MFADGGTVRAWPERARKIVAVGSAVHNVLERVEVLAPAGPAIAWVMATNVYHRTAQGWRLVAHHASPGTTSEIQEVSDALAGRRYLAEQVAAQERGATAQRQIAELARVRYREGTVAYIQVLDAERNLFAAEQALLQLRRAQAQNLVGLYVALGGGATE